MTFGDLDMILTSCKVYCMPRGTTWPTVCPVPKFEFPISEIKEGNTLY